MVFLGIDGGGSKTAFLLEDENGKTLGRIETGPSNWLSAGAETAKRSITEGLRKLDRVPDVIGCGFAGAGRPEGLQFFKDCIVELLPSAKLFIETDAFISYIGAIGLEPGVLLIAGTGSIAIGRRADGSMIRVGGWGSLFDDEGSGFWIGRETIQWALRAYDAGTDNEFVNAVSTGLQLNSITDVSAAWKAGHVSVRSVASLTKFLFDRYPTEPAKSILTAAAKHLTAISQIAIAKVEVPNCRRSIIGSVGSSPLMKQLLREQGNIGEFEAPRESPERGAIIWARSRCHQ